MIGLFPLPFLLYSLAVAMAGHPPSKCQPETWASSFISPHFLTLSSFQVVNTLAGLQIHPCSSLFSLLNLSSDTIFSLHYFISPQVNLLINIGACLPSVHAIDCSLSSTAKSLFWSHFFCLKIPQWLPTVISIKSKLFGVIYIYAFQWGPGHLQILIAFHPQHTNSEFFALVYVLSHLYGLLTLECPSLPHFASLTPTLV